jgi:hypothetical protein
LTREHYGPPYGSAEDVRQALRHDLGGHRDDDLDEGGYTWLGPYGEWGSRKYLLASLDQAAADGLEYVDIFYSHRFDPSRRSRDDGCARHGRPHPASSYTRADSGSGGSWQAGRRS